MDTKRISLTDFRGQISYQSDSRVSAGLPPLDIETEIRAAMREWNRRLAEARTRLQNRASYPLANNSFTHQVLARQIEGDFRAYLIGLGVPERRARAASPPVLRALPPPLCGIGPAALRAEPSDESASDVPQ